VRFVANGAGENANVTEHQSKRFFTRTDGRVAPECDYRLDDWQDEYSDATNSKSVQTRVGVWYPQ